MKKILTTIIPLLLLTACDKEVDYSVEIEVQNFYTEETLAGQTVIVEFCEVGLMWGYSCDSITSKVTDQNGRTKFNKTYKIEYGKGYEFQVKSGNGYAISNKVKPKNGTTHIFKVKPFTRIFLTIDTTAAIDSLKVFMSNKDGYSDHININAGDKLLMEVKATPDEENWLSVNAYKNGMLEAWKDENEIYPTLTGTDSLIISIP